VVLLRTALGLLWIHALAFAGPAPGVLVSTQTTWFGMCDASAAVALSSNRFAVANDEDNAIRVFQLDRPGLPVQAIDFSGFLGVDPRKPESDLEGATWLGDTIFWITSHGQNRTGKFRLSRHRIFATHMAGAANTPRMLPVGQPYFDLLADLLSEPKLRPFNLRDAFGRPPKTPGALNIEGLCATPATNLLIGFRNPIPQRRALIVPLLNPVQILRGQGARLGAPILLDLEGRGIRDIARWRDHYVIIAGSFDGKGRSHLYLWDGTNAAPQKIERTHLKKLNPEAVVSYPQRAEGFQLLSDDGTDLIHGIPCKNLPNPAQRRFRSVWVDWSKAE
jgi:hypothetical protein